MLDARIETWPHQKPQRDPVSRRPSRQDMPEAGEGLQVLELKTKKYDKPGKLDYAVQKHATA